jgi:hypothetical protein
MTTHHLESRISTLRGQVRRLLAVHGLSRVVALAVALAVVAGALDWLFHLDSVVRAGLLGLIVGSIGWLGLLGVVRPLVIRFADLDIAMRIEDRWPGLEDRLTSTVQFLHLDPADDRYGSSALREATIRQALEETARIDFRDVVEKKPVYRAVGLAAGALAIALGVMLLDPVSSRLALRRLALPFGGDRWPQRTHFVLDDQATTLKVARGGSFTLGVRVRPGDLVPESARVTYRFPDGEEVGESLRSLEGGEFRGRIDTVNQPFRFSVAGGDDRTSIRDVAVQVVPPPALKNLSVRLVSPDYTGIPIQTLAPGLTQMRVLQGTRIELEAEANKPLARAELRLGNDAAKEPVTFDPGRIRFRTHFPVQENATFWFDLKDDEGFKGRDAVRYDVRSFKDEAPRVVIDEPISDRDVPADAIVPVRMIVDDDYGIHSIQLIYRVATGESEPNQDAAIPLWAADGEGAQTPAGRQVRHQEAGHSWDLSPLKLSPGSIITFFGTARDYDSLKGPNLGKSRELRLRIVSKEDAARQFDDARRELREELARIVAMQRQAIVPVEEASRSLTKSDRLPTPQRDNLKNASMIQRQVGGRIGSRDDGLEQKLRRLLADLRNFKIANPDAQNQMENMLGRLQQVRDRNQVPAEQGLSRASKSLEEVEFARTNPIPGERPTGVSDPQKSARTNPISDPQNARTNPISDQKSARTNPISDQKAGVEPEKVAQPVKSPAQDARQALAQARTYQQAIADELQKMLDGLSEFETYRGVVKDAQALLKQHEQTMKETAESSSKPDLMGKPVNELTPEQKADLGNLAARQSQVAKNLRDLLERMDEMAKRLEETDPLAGAALKEAAEQSRKQATAGKLGEAADQLERNQMGQAESRQEQARQEIRDLVDSIQNRRERELARLVKELKNAEADLRKLRVRQAQNLKKTRDAQKKPDSKERKAELQKLAKEQAEIQKELKRQLQKLAKLNAERAGRAGENARAKMSKAESQLDQDQADEAGKDQEEALADLNDAQDELEQTRRDAEEQLATEQLAKMGDHLKSLAERQEKVVGDTDSYEKTRRQAGGKLTVAQRSGVRSLGQVQSGLREETSDLVRKLDGAPVFSLTLKRAAENMDDAAKRLLAIKTDADTQAAARRAADRFKQILESLKPDTGKNGGQGGGGGGGGGGAGDGDGIPAAAQLKMLKGLQEEVNQKTEAIEEARRRTGGLTPEQVKALDRLAEEQGGLADIMRDMTRPRRADGED